MRLLYFKQMALSRKYLVCIPGMKLVLAEWPLVEMALTVQPCSLDVDITQSNWHFGVHCMYGGPTK